MAPGKLPEEGVNQQSCLTVMPVIHRNNQQKPTVAPAVGSYQQLSSQTYDSLNKEETMPNPEA